MATPQSDGSIILNTKVDTSGLKTGVSTIKGGVSSLTTAFGKLAGAIGIAFSVGAIVKFSKEASNLATKTEASVQRLIDIYGSASKAVGDFIDANANALGMSKAAAASYASVYGNLFSVWADQQTNASLTTQYLQMTAVVASKTGRTVEDVQERVRSGLLGNTEAIEDLGIFVNVKTIEMTNAFKRMADGKSWEQLDAYTQQQIRSMAILEQATVKYGNEVANTTALTKSQFQAAWEDFQATWGQVINKVLIPVLEVLTDILVKATVVMQTLFGISSATISHGNAISNATDKQDALTDSVKETEKAAKKAVAPFDDLQIISEKTSENLSSGTGNTGELTLPSFDTVSSDGVIDVEDSPIIKLIKRIQEISQPSIDALERIGTALKPFENFIAQGVMDFYNNFLVPVGTWVLGEGFPRFADAIANGINAIDWGTLNTSLSSFFDQLSRVAMFYFDSIIDFYELFLVPLGAWAVGEAFPRFVDTITQLFAQVDWETLNSALERMWSALKPFAETVGEGLLWFWENPISYLIGFFTKSDENGDSIISLSIGAIAEAISFLEECIQAAMDALEWIWDTFFVPIGDFLWEQTIDFLKSLVKAFEGLSDWAKENPESMQMIADIVLGFLAGLWVYNSTKKIIDFISKLIMKFKEFGGLQGMMTLIGNAINSPALAIGALTAAGLFWVANWDKIKAAFEGMSAWQKVITVVLGLAAAIAVLWVAISVGVAAAGIVAGFAALGLGAGILLMGNLNEKAKKTSEPTSIPTGRSAISSTVPTKTINGYSIPGYAKGTVVPPNRPHLAWFGDNATEPEIVSPVSTMKSAFMEAMMEMGGSSYGAKEVVLELDGRELGRAIVEQGNRENHRIGTRLVNN